MIPAEEFLQVNTEKYIAENLGFEPSFYRSMEEWKKEILDFSLNTSFEKLEVLDFKEKNNNAAVVFIAHLKHADADATFTERSFFSKVDGRWLYINGDVFPGEVRDLQA